MLTVKESVEVQIIPVILNIAIVITTTTLEVDGVLEEATVEVDTIELPMGDISNG